MQAENDHDASCKDGNTYRVYLTAREAPDVLKVPPSALVRTVVAGLFTSRASGSARPEAEVQSGLSEGATVIEHPSVSYAKSRASRTVHGGEGLRLALP